MKKFLYVWDPEDGTSGLEEVELGGSSAFASNWCRIQVGGGRPAAVLAVGSLQYLAVADDLSINGQSGSDFSIADSVSLPGVGALYSAAGGWFEVSVAVTLPNVTLDGGSTAPRYMIVGLVGSGSGAPPFDGFGGIDSIMQLDPNQAFNPLVHYRLDPSKVEPGGEVFRDVQYVFQGATGTDQIPNAFPAVVGINVWQVG